MPENAPPSSEYGRDEVLAAASKINEQTKKHLRQKATGIYLNRGGDNLNIDQLRELLQELESDIGELLSGLPGYTLEDTTSEYITALELARIITNRIDKLELRQARPIQPAPKTTPVIPSEPSTPTTIIPTKRSRVYPLEASLPPTERVIPAHEPNLATQRMYDTGTALGALIDLAGKQNPSSQQPSRESEQNKYIDHSFARIDSFEHLTPRELAEQQHRARDESSTIVRSFEDNLSLFELKSRYNSIAKQLQDCAFNYDDFHNQIANNQISPNPADVITRSTELEREYGYLRELSTLLRAYIDQWALPTYPEASLPDTRKRELQDWKSSVARDLRNAKTITEIKSIISAATATFSIEIAEYSEHDKRELLSVVQEALRASFNANNRKHYEQITEQLREYRESEFEHIQHEQLPILFGECMRNASIRPDTAKIASEISEKTQALYEQSYTANPLSIKPRILATELKRLESITIEPNPFDAFNSALQTHWNDSSWNIDDAYEAAEQAYTNLEYIQSLRAALEDLRTKVVTSAEPLQARKTEISDRERAREQQYRDQFRVGVAHISPHQFYTSECTVDSESERLAAIDCSRVFDIIAAYDSIPNDFDMADRLNDIRVARENKYQSEERTRLLQKQSNKFAAEMRIGGSDHEKERLLSNDYSYYTKGDTIKKIYEKKNQDIIQKELIANGNFNISKLAFNEKFIEDYGQNPTTIHDQFLLAHAELSDYFTPANRPLIEDLDSMISTKIVELQNLTLQYHRCVKYYPLITAERQKLHLAVPPTSDNYRTGHEQATTASKWTHEVKDALGNVTQTIDYKNAEDVKEKTSKETETLWKNHWKNSSIADLHIELRNRDAILASIRTNRDNCYNEFLDSFGLDELDQFVKLEEWKYLQREFCVAETHIKELKKYLNAFPTPDEHQCSPDHNTIMRCAPNSVPINIYDISNYQRTGVVGPLGPTLQWIELTLSDSSHWPPGGLGFEEVNLDSYTGDHGVSKSLEKIKKKLDDEIKIFKQHQRTGGGVLSIGYNTDSGSNYLGFFTLALAYLERKKSELETEFKHKYIIDPLPTNELDPNSAKEQRESYEKHIASECGKLSEGIYQISKNTNLGDQQKATRIRDMFIQVFLEPNKGSSSFNVRTNTKGEPIKDLVIDGRIHYGEIARRAIVQFAIDMMNTDPSRSLLHNAGITIGNIPTIGHPYLSSSELAELALKLKHDNDPMLRHTNPAQAQAQHEREYSLGQELRSKVDSLHTKTERARILYGDYPKTREYIEKCYVLSETFYNEAQSAGFDQDSVVGDIYTVTKMPRTVSRTVGKTVEYETPYLPIKSTYKVSELLKALELIEEQIDFALPSNNPDKPNYGDLLHAASTTTQNGDPCISPEERVAMLDSLFVRGEHSANGTRQLVLPNIKESQIYIKNCVKTLEELRRNKTRELINLRDTYSHHEWYKQLDSERLLANKPFDPSLSQDILACAILRSHQSMSRGISITTRRLTGMLTSKMSNFFK